MKYIFGRYSARAALNLQRGGGWRVAWPMCNGGSIMTVGFYGVMANLGYFRACSARRSRRLPIAAPSIREAL